MPVGQIKPNIAPRYNATNIQPRRQASGAQNVSFTGKFNPVVGLMDFIAAGGFAASFCIQDGLGFIFPRVRHGLLNGGKEKKDENGNIILDENGKPKHELNWAYARKEGIREIITGPSAFIIPYFLLKGISKKFGMANRVKLDYINSFEQPFTEFAQANIEALQNGTADRKGFYEKVFANTIEQSINSNLPQSERMSAQEVLGKAKEFAQKLINTENIDPALGKEEKAAKLLENSVENAFMNLKKEKIGGAVDEMAVQLSSAKGVAHGSIGELVEAMGNYYQDASQTIGKALKSDTAKKVEDLLKSFSKHKMGSRFFTNIGLFLAVALFYTQIPKLYNMGLKGNPALGENNNTNPAKQETSKVSEDSAKNVSFTGGATGFLEKTGEKIFNGKVSKQISDIFELNGGIISASAMPALLYGFCIPPRLFNAQDKYDYKDIFVRDLTAFTALLFGAKALGRVFSDGFTKLTGLALNKKNLEGRNFYQKILDYFNPTAGRHTVLSSKQLESKYTNIEGYKGGVNGFIEFIEQSGGNIKKALSKDKDVKEVVNSILKSFNGKTFAQATVEEIKQALNNAHLNKTDLIKKFYKLFESENGLLRSAKTCNSFFDFLSTLVLVPSLIVGLTKYCKNMTEKAKAKDDAAISIVQAQRAPLVPSSKPTMAGFLSRT